MIQQRTLKRPDEDGEKEADEAEEDHMIRSFSVGYAVFGTLQKLRISLEKLSSKDLFPYNVRPLIRRLTQIEATLDRFLHSHEPEPTDEVEETHIVEEGSLSDNQ